MNNPTPPVESAPVDEIEAFESFAEPYLKAPTRDEILAALENSIAAWGDVEPEKVRFTVVLDIHRLRAAEAIVREYFKAKRKGGAR